MMEKNIFVSEISKMAIFKKYIVCKYYKKKNAYISHKYHEIQQFQQIFKNFHSHVINLNFPPRLNFYHHFLKSTYRPEKTPNYHDIRGPP